MRARRGLRVELDAERGCVQQPDALDHAVVEIDVADLGAAERRVKRRGHASERHPGCGLAATGHAGAALAGAGLAATGHAGAALAGAGLAAVPRTGSGEGDGEAVVVAGDPHPPGGRVLDRLVDATVPETQLVGGQPERPGEDLAAKADAEQRDTRGVNQPVKDTATGRV